jgi:hypothetical protein
VPRTTKVPKKEKAAQAPPSGDVLTLQEVVAAVWSQGLPARLVGEEWRFLKIALQQWLCVSQPTAEMRKAAQLELAGVWKDDPDAMQILEDAMRRRGRQPGPDGTYSGYRPSDEA